MASIGKITFVPAKYFLRYAGRDGKLSWKEIQKSPARGLNAKGKTKVTYQVTRDTFNNVQSKKYDNDTTKLNYREFLKLVEKVGMPHSVWRAKMPQCHNILSISTDGNDGASTALQKKLRKAVREGLIAALRETWPAQRSAIAAAIKKGKLAEVTKLLHGYLSQIATTAHYHNPKVEKYCESVSVASLYEMAELVSTRALQHKVIKGFWRDVSRLFKALLQQARVREIKDLNKIWGSQWSGDKVRDYESDNPSFKDLFKSKFTLKDLVAKTNPKLALAITNWGK